jgi:HlyD family secretion protein
VEVSVARLNRKIILPVVISAAIAALAVYWAINHFRDRGRPLEAAGTLEAVEVDVGALVAGRIVAIYYDEGDDVAEGATVATLDAEELEAGLAAAEAGAAAAEDRVAAAGAAFAAAQDRFARVARAYPGGGVTKAEYERAKAERDAASAELASARSLAAQAKAAKAQLDARRKEIEIVAPLSGTVLSRNLEPGEVLSPGVSLMTLADLSALELYVYVPESEVGSVDVGDPVEVAVDSFPGEMFAGKVKAVASRTEFTPRNVESKEDRVTLVFKVTVKVPNPGGRLKPGMPADAAFTAAAARTE